MIASSALSIAVTVRTGARELQVISALIAHRLEQAGAPDDPALVKKLTIDLYLNSKRTPDLADDKLRLVRLTRKWVLTGALGRKTSKRAARALDAVEKLDIAWDLGTVGLDEEIADAARYRPEGSARATAARSGIVARCVPTG